MSKLDIVRRAFALNVPLEKTWSCYVDGDDPCGICDSCRLREEAIAQVKTETQVHVVDVNLVAERLSS
jgi:7-cyano-7-deazaguanine synthase